MSISNIVYITTDTIYAIKLGSPNSYWRLSWDIGTFASAIQDVISTLNTSEFCVVLGSTLPSIGSYAIRTHADLSEQLRTQVQAYTQALLDLGCQPQGVFSSPTLIRDYLLSQGHQDAEVLMSKYEQGRISLRDGQITLLSSELDLVHDSAGYIIYSDQNSLSPQTQKLPDITSLLKVESHAPQANPEFHLGSLEDLESPRQSKLGFGFFAVLALTLILAVVLAWVLYQPDTSLKEITPAPSEAPTQTPQATVIPTVPSPSNSSFAIQIQNGSGVAGSASKYAAILEQSGFTIKDITNAKNYNYQNSVVQAKTRVPKKTTNELLQLLQAESLSVDILDDDSPYDIVIILGKSQVTATSED
jgi:hypothetical protein